MKKIIVANWKMAPSTLQEAEDLFRASSGAVVCPPFVYLEELSKIKSGAILGAQDIAASDEPGQPGSRSSDSGVAAKDNKSELSLPGQTGEVSGEMLKQLGIRFVLIGHSERRWKLGESDEIVNKKLKEALEHKLIPIVCIGEKSCDNDFAGFLQNQVLATFSGLTAEQIQKCLVAYEPVWAISTTPGAKVDTPESALESIRVINEVLVSNFEFRISNFTYLYGGSVTAANVRDFLIKDQISGVLVGGASVDKKEFLKILEISS